MFGRLDMVRDPAEVGLGLLFAVLIATLIAPVAADDVALVSLMTADDIVSLMTYSQFSITGLKTILCYCLYYCYYCYCLLKNFFLLSIVFSIII
jgi:hypothetical protein